MGKCCGVISGEGAELIWQAAIDRKNEIAKRLPTEQDAINAMFDAYSRLKELGWREAIYCPKGGTAFHAMSVGSTGIHTTWYDGVWPDGYYLTTEDDEVYHTHPVLFKPIISPI